MISLGMMNWTRLILHFLVIVHTTITAFGAETGCGGKPADIAFVLDSSSSIYLEDYDKQLEFVKEIVEIFDIGPEKMRVAAVAFSDDVYPQVDLATYNSTGDLQDALASIEYYGGGTHTDKALKYLRKVVFSKDNTRENVPKIAIVLTDGLSNSPDATKQEALLAREDGIILFVVGIGWGVDEGELASIASQPKANFVLQIDDFSALSTIKDKLAIKACEAEKHLEPVVSNTGTDSIVKEACSGKPADVVFALDTSTSIYMEDYNKQLKFVKDVVNMFDIGPEKTRVGLLTFSDNAYPQFSLTTYNTKTHLKDAIMDVEYTGGSTSTDIALEFMRDIAFEPSLDRPEAVKIGIILTDGLSHNTRKTLYQASLTKKSITLFVIGIGPEVDGTELDGIASSPSTSHRFTTDDFDALQFIKKKLAIKACAVQTKPETQGDQPIEDCSRIGPTDIVFGIDTARFGDSRTFHILKFINNFVSSFDVGSETTRLSVISTACANRTDMILFSHFSKSSFQHDLLHFASSDFGDLVKKVRVYGFSKKNGGRGKNSAKLAVLFFTGEPNNIDDLRGQILRAKFTGIKLFIVGIRVKIEKDVLVNLFGGDFDDFYLALDEINELDQAGNRLLRKLCSQLLSSQYSRVFRELLLDL